MAGLALLDGLLTMPLSGSWSLEGTVELPDAAGLPSGRVNVIVAGDGEPNASLDGFIASATNPDTGSAYVRVVGGATGAFSAELALSRIVQGRHYDGDPVPVTAAEVLADLADEVGETIPASALVALQDLSAVSWHRPTGLASTALRSALNGPASAPWGLSARFLPTAELWAGVETWPAIVEPKSVDPTDDGRALYIAPNGLSVFPGVTTFGKKIRRVQYVFTRTALRVRLWYGDV